MVDANDLPAAPGADTARLCDGPYLCSSMCRCIATACQSNRPGTAEWPSDSKALCRAYVSFTPLKGRWNKRSGSQRRCPDVHRRRSNSRNPDHHSAHPAAPVARTEPIEGRQRRQTNVRAASFEAALTFVVLEATAGFEPAMEVLQTSALPLGHVALVALRTVGAEEGI